MSGIQFDDSIEYLRKALDLPIYPDGKNIDPKLAVGQFSKTIQVLSDPTEQWSQGDILNKISFLGFTKEGRVSNYEAPAMIITNTCDLDRKETIVLCPCYPLEKFKPLKSYSDIPKNNVAEYFYIGEGLTGGNWVVDLGHPMTLPRDRMFEKIERGDITRLHSLTQIGWYLFITKFSIKYLRPDDPTTMQERQSQKRQNP